MVPFDLQRNLNWQLQKACMTMISECHRQDSDTNLAILHSAYSTAW